MSEINKVLVIGSGPIIIGQAAEFDYSGSQACRALREEGITTVLVNSNPATIMTDEGIADTVYIEPLTVEIVKLIIEKERPDGLLPTLGGQTGLNLAVDLAEAGILDKYGVRTLGTSIETIQIAEDRGLFKQLLIDIGEPVPESATVTNMDEAREVAQSIGLPLVIRPAYTLGGTGGGIAKTEKEFELITSHGIAMSPIHQVLLEKCLIGWKEMEYEVMRDSGDNCITICNMENIDPMGIHTGESIVVAPSQTLTDKEYQMLRSASLRIIRALGIEGGCNVQFALEPHPIVGTRQEDDSPYYVIEVNPRVSRSSALASKATGYPIARVAAKIAVGKTLDEIANKVTGKTTAAFEPALDYCVVKIPRWPFDKFTKGNRNLGTQMKSTGETMSIERTFEAALKKAVRSLEVGTRTLLWEDPTWRDGSFPLEPTDQRLWAMFAAIRQGMSIEELCHRTGGIDPWFLYKFQNIVDMENRLRSEPLAAEIMRDAKRMGFSDREIGILTNHSAEEIRKMRHQWGLRPVYKMVDTCAAEFAAETPYFYSTYEQENEAIPITGEKALVIGSGPIRIGQGIEFDYCSIHSAWALQESGVKAIMVNSNPETVSTDFDTSDRLYFEPLDEESIRDILENETAESASPSASIVQFGGQTSINLAEPLTRSGLTLLGSSFDSIDLAEDRDRFQDMMNKLGIPMAESGMASSLDEALVIAERIGYPLMVRPSYVLGGRGMEVVYDEEMLTEYFVAAIDVPPDRPILIDRFLENAIEVEADAIADGTDAFVPAIMEHIEPAGIHSGDSACVIPPVSLPQKHIDTINEYTQKIAGGLNVVGLMNVQYAICDDVVYVIEANPRASRTAPIVSKVCGLSMAKLATQVMLGKKISDLNLKQRSIPHYGVKQAVFPFPMFPEMDPILGPEMRSTGEVLGIADSFGMALFKAEEATRQPLPTEGCVLFTIADKDKATVAAVARQFKELGFSIKTTEGTRELLNNSGIDSDHILKLHEGQPNIVDGIIDGEIQLIINTPAGKTSKHDDSYIRKTAIKYRVPYITTMAGAAAAAKGIAAYRQGHVEVRSLKEHHAGIR